MAIIPTRAGLQAVIEDERLIQKIGDVVVKPVQQSLSKSNGVFITTARIIEVLLGSRLNMLVKFGLFLQKKSLDAALSPIKFVYLLLKFMNQQEIPVTVTGSSIMNFRERTDLDVSKSTIEFYLAILHAIFIATGKSLKFVASLFVIAWQSDLVLALLTLYFIYQVRKKVSKLKKPKSNSNSGSKAPPNSPTNNGGQLRLTEENLRLLQNTIMTNVAQPQQPAPSTPSVITGFTDMTHVTSRERANPSPEQYAHFVACKAKNRGGEPCTKMTRSLTHYCYRHKMAARSKGLIPPKKEFTGTVSKVQNTKMSKKALMGTISE